jgi:hypothetical protein
MLEDDTKPGQGPGDGQLFRNRIREGMPTMRSECRLPFPWPSLTRMHL